MTTFFIPSQDVEQLDLDELAADPDWPVVTTVIGDRLFVAPITDPDVLGDEATPYERWLVERGQRVA